MSPSPVAIHWPQWLRAAVLTGAGKIGDKVLGWHKVRGQIRDAHIKQKNLKGLSQESVATSCPHEVLGTADSANTQPKSF